VLDEVAVVLDAQLRNSFARSTICCFSASSSGRDVGAREVAVVVVDAVDRRLAPPVPRGSHPTMSKCSRRVSL
jgi:hypothetical protein